MTDVARGPSRFLPKLIFSSGRLEVSTRPDGAIRLDWVGDTHNDELDRDEVSRLVAKLHKWQRESGDR